MGVFYWISGVCAAATLLAVGCAQKPAAVPIDGPPRAITQGRPSNAPRDAIETGDIVYHIDLFIVSAPVGSFSGNEAFWKRIDEQCVDPGTNDLLQKNGVRVGVAPLAELTHFASFIDPNAPAQRLALTGAARDAQLEMKTGIPEQHLFYFDRLNTLIGDSSDRCENIMNISFAHAPRKPGHLRLTLCPMVREIRKKMQFTQLNDTFDIQFVNRKRYYDLNFEVDIPADSFLIVTPSTFSTQFTNVGRAFFIKDEATELREQILIVVPQPLRVEAQPATK